MGNVPHVIPPEMKPKSGDEAMNEVLRQAEKPAGRQEKVAEQRRQSLTAGIQPPKFMENAMKQTEEKAAPKEPPKPAKPEKPEPAAPGAKSVAKPAAKTPAPKPQETAPQSKKEPAKPAQATENGTIQSAKVPEKPAQETTKQAASPAPVTQAKPMTQPAKTPAPETQEPERPDVMTMSKAELRNFFATVDRMAFQKLLQSKGEFANRGIFLGRASEQQMREYARLVLNA